MREKIQTLGPVVVDIENMSVVEVAEIVPSFNGTLDERDSEEVVSALGQIAHIRSLAKRLIEGCALAEKAVLEQYQPALESYTAANFPKGKKTISLAAGDIGYRSSKETISVTSDADAAGVLRELWDGPEEFLEEAIRMVPKVLITKIPDELMDKIRADITAEIPSSHVSAGFEYKPKVDKFFCKPKESA